MKVPRPSGGSRQSAGVGKIFVKYDNAESAKKALQSLAGRKFADRTVVTTYFSEVRSSLCLVVGTGTNMSGRKISKSMLGRRVGQKAVSFSTGAASLELDTILVLLFDCERRNILLISEGKERFRCEESMK